MRRSIKEPSARLGLLEAVGRLGSIQAAARATGYSYRGAWLALEAMSAAAGRALVERSAGGRGGGGSRLTPEGWGLLRTAARSRFLGRVRRLRRGTGESEVELSLLGARALLVATVPSKVVSALRLRAGASAAARVRARDVVLAVGRTAPRVSARNVLEGRVESLQRTRLSASVSLRVGNGPTLTVALTRSSADSLDLRVGSRVWALFKAGAVSLEPPGR